MCLLACGPAGAGDLTVLQVVPLTGVDGGLGHHMRVGAQVAFDELNAQNPLSAGPVKLITLDEQVGQVLPQLRQAVATHAPLALLGWVGRQSVQELGRGQWLSAWQLPLVGVNTGSVQALSPWPTGLYLTRGSYVDELDHVFQHLATISTRQVALVTTDDDDGREISALVQAQARQAGVRVVFTSNHPHGSAAVADAVEAVLRLPHEAVIVASNTAAVANFAKLYAKGGGRGQLVALSSAEATQLAAVVGATAARGILISQMVPSPRDPKLALMREFQSAYKRFGPGDLVPTLAMTEAYIAARVLIDGLRRCPAPVNHQTLWRVMLNAPSTLTLGDLPISLNRRGPQFRSLSMIAKDGTLVY